MPGKTGDYMQFIAAAFLAISSESSEVLSRTPTHQRTGLLLLALGGM